MEKFLSLEELSAFSTNQETINWAVPMVKDGTNSFIENVDTKIHVISINGKLIPISVNEKEYENAYVVSNYFPICFWKEQLSNKTGLKKWVQEGISTLSGLFLKWIKINKVVVVNNWLFPTNLHAKLSKIEVVKITKLLVDQFPDHAIIFRNIDMHACSELAKHLDETKYRLMKTRNIFIYDPGKKDTFSAKVNYHHRRDLRLLDKLGYEVVNSESLTEEDLKRIIELYQGIYLNGYTKYSPKYTVHYLHHLIEKKIIHIVGIKKEGKIDGCFGSFEKDGQMITTFFGYEKNIETKAELYRLLTVLILKEAEKRNLILNDGSGSASPKKYRGMQPFLEYTAIYDRHLPWARQIFWALSKFAMNRWVYPKLKE